MQGKSLVGQARREVAGGGRTDVWKLGRENWKTARLRQKLKEEDGRNAGFGRVLGTVSLGQNDGPQRVSWRIARLVLNFW